MLCWLKKIISRRSSNVRITGNSTNVSLNGKTIKLKELTERHFDEIKTETAENFDTIKIDSGCPVKISSSNSMNVEVHFYGDTYFKGNVNFNVTQVSNELTIKVELDGIFQNTNLQLDISIPNGKKFKKISVETTFDDIEFIDSAISSEKLCISTSSGESILRGNFDDIKIQSTSGDVDIYSKCANNLRIDNSSGDITIGGHFKNIGIESNFGQINLDADSVEKLKLKTSSGDAEIRGDFKDVEIESSFGKIILEANSVDKLKLETSSGDADIEGDFKDIIIKSTHGEITANIYAKSDIQISIETGSANAEFNFENVRKVNMSGSTSLGDSYNNLHAKSDGYIANIKYETTFGDITIN